MRPTPLLFAAVLALSAPHAVAQDASIDDQIRDYILNNPEIILEALSILTERQVQAELEARLAEFPELFTDAPHLGEGDPNAPIRVVEFFDYKCIPCKAVHPAVVAFVDANPAVRVEMRHLPILTPGSERASRFALAAQAAYGDQTYRDVHDKIWALRGPLNTAGFERIAEELSLDFAVIEAEMESEAITARIDYNRDVAIALEVLGTPAFLTPDSVVVGSTDIDALSEVWLSQ